MNKKRIERRNKNEEIKQEKFKKKMQNQANGFNCDLDVQEVIEAQKSYNFSAKEVTAG
jgi:hypothetical protein